jgi:hypothetical protein
VTPNLDHNNRGEQCDRCGMSEWGLLRYIEFKFNPFLCGSCPAVLYEIEAAGTTEVDA